MMERRKCLLFHINSVMLFESVICMKLISITAFKKEEALIFHQGIGQG